MRVVALLFAVAVLLASAPLAVGATVRPFSARGIDFAPVTVFGEWVFGVKDAGVATLVMAQNVMTGEERAVGIVHGNTTPVFTASGSWLVAVERTAVTVWNSSADMVGRLAASDLISAKVMNDGTLVAWSSDIVYVAHPPGYARPTPYPMKEVAEGVVESVYWEDAVRLSGNDPDDIVGLVVSLVKQKIPEGASNVSVSVDASIIPPVGFTVVDAGYCGGSLYVAGNVNYSYNVTVTATWVAGNETRSATAYSVTTVSYGVLVRGGSLVKTYASVLASAHSDTLAFVFKGVGDEYPSVAFMKGGELREVKMYGFRDIRDVYVLGNLVAVASDIGFAVLDDSGLLASIPGDVVSIGYSTNKVYALFRSPTATLEIGTYDIITGTAGKVVLQIDGYPVGAYISPDIIVVAAISGGSGVLYAYAVSGMTTFTLSFVDAVGQRVPLVSGNATVIFHSFVATTPITGNPFTLTVPVGAVVEVEAEAPLLKGNITLHATREGAFDVAVPLIGTIVVGSPGAVESVPFTNVFFRDHAVVSQNSTAHFILPPGMDVDAYGSLVAIARQPTTSVGTEVAVYSVAGEFMWSVHVPVAGVKVKFMWPYLVAYTNTVVRVFSAVTGTSLIADNGLHDGWDIDTVSGYLVVWEGSTLRVYDLRHGTRTATVDAGSEIVAAVPIAGQVIAYVQKGDGIYAYVINPNTGNVMDTYFVGNVFESFVSDGVFHAVSFIRGGEHYTIIISEENGPVILQDGPVVWVRDLGNVVSLNTGPVIGARFAAIAVAEGGITRVWVVGLNAEKVAELASCGGNPSFNSYYFASIREEGNRSVIVLYDWSGSERVILIPTSIPTNVIALPQYLVYTTPDSTIVVPMPLTLGKYSITVTVQDAEGRPLPATIKLVEYGAKFSIAGSGKIYLSIPGKVTIEASSPNYVSSTEVVEVNNTIPAATATFVLEPVRYTLTIKVRTPEGKDVEAGEVLISDVTTGAGVARLNVTYGVAMAELPPGNYVVEFVSPYYERGNATVSLTKDTSVELVVRQTKIPFKVVVVDENGQPVSNASVTAMLAGTAIPSSTDSNGVAEIVLPNGVPVNITVAKPHYIPESVKVVPSPENTSVSVTLKRFVAIVTVQARDSDGNPVTGTLTVMNATNNAVILSQTVSGTASLTLPEGIYKITLTTEDGRTAAQTISVTMQNNVVSTELVVPPPPVPFYIKYFPYIVIVAVATVFVIVFIRKMRK